MQGLNMPIKSKLRVLIAQRNLERAADGKRALTQNRISKDTGLPNSVVNGLVTNRTTRVDYGTLEKLCRYLDAQPGDILVYDAEAEAEAEDSTNE